MITVHPQKKSSPRIHSYQRTRNDDPLISHPMPPNPEPYQVTYDDGTMSPFLRLRINGDETDLSHQIWEETLDGFTVAPSGGKYVYVEVNDESGELIETDLVVGVDDPYASRIRKGAAAASQAKAAAAADKDEGVEYEIDISADEEKKVFGGRGLRKGGQQQQDHRRTVITSGTLKNLVIPFKFSDHTTRSLPSRSHLNTLMNNNGPNNLCPTGSVRDVYLESSHGQLDLDSTVIEWVTLDHTEAQCAGGQSGLFTGFHTCLTNALDKAVAAGVDFGDYDLDGNGIIDGITFFHSGYAAEFGGTDQYGTPGSGRIWSHKWVSATRKNFPFVFPFVIYNNAILTLYFYLLFLSLLP